MRRYLSKHRGSSLIWVVVVLTILSGIVAMAVDFGRVQSARAELQSAADAAALTAVAALPSVSEARADAVLMASMNKVEGTAVNLVLSNADDNLNDVQFVTWNGSTFTVLNGSARSGANAVRVIARRTRERGNAVPLMFGSILGLSTIDTAGSAIAMQGLTSYAVVGLDFITMSGNTTASYSAAKDATITGKYGNVASNGNITLTGSTFINGNARPGIGMSVSAPAKVSGITAPLNYPLVFPDIPQDAPTNFATVNNNSDFNAWSGVRTGPIGNPNVYFNGPGSYALPGGVYYVNDFIATANAELSFASPTYLFVYGNFKLHAKAVTSGSLPKNLVIVTVSRNGNPPGTVEVGSTSAFYGTVYAPLSPIYLSGTGDIYGAVLGKSISMSGTSRIIYDRSLQAAGDMMKLVH